MSAQAVAAASGGSGGEASDGGSDGGTPGGQGGTGWRGLFKQGEAPQTYRADIDGLRAVAVTAVVVYHAFPSLLPGGFVGVDVFFVVSGFLISNIVFQELQSSTWSLPRFYHRRVRRLFPALLLVMTTCLVAGWFLLLPDEYAQLGKHVAGGAAFVSNLILRAESNDYFDKGGLVKPLRHLWSLGIEEQFYLTFPPVLAMLFRRRRRLAPVLVVAAIVSFAVNVLLVQLRARNTAFYHPVPRAWELLMGVFVGRMREARTAGRAASLEATCGLALLGVAFASLSDGAEFPGVLALLPTVGTALIIHAGPSSLVNARLLSRPALVAVGLFSYPLYLWHWPLLSFAAILAHGMTGAPWSLLVLLCVFLSFALAAATYHLVELPLRRRARGDAAAAWSRYGSLLCALLAIVGATGFAIKGAKGFPARFALNGRLLQTMALFELPAETNQRQCPAEMTSLEYCMVEHLERPPTDVLVGDSHATHLYPGLKQRLDEKAGRNLLVLAQSATPPCRHLGVVRFRGLTDDALLHYAASLPSVETVYLAAFWADYADWNPPNPKGGPGGTFHEPLVDLTHEAGADGRNALVGRGLDRTLGYLTRHGKKVVVFLDIPTLPFVLSSCLPRPVDIFPSRYFACSLSDGNPQVDRNAIRSVIQDVVAHYPSARVVDPIPVFCSSSVCKVVADDTILYADEHHLSTAGAEWLFERLHEEW